MFRKTGYSRPHTDPLRARRASTSRTLGGGGKDGTDGPPGIFIMDCETFDVIGRWEIDRGPQDKHYDFWWNLPRDYMVSSEWGLPPQFENGIVPEDLLAQQIRPPHPLLGPARAPQRPDDRPRRQPPDGAGGAPGARPDQGIRLRRRRRRHHQPRGLDLDLVARGRQVPLREDRDHPARAGRRRTCCRRCCRASAPCRRWSPTSTCRSTTASSTSPAGAPARCASTTSATR